MDTECHEQVLGQQVFAPIYQPIQSFAYRTEQLILAAQIRSSRIQSQTFLDIEGN